MAYFEQKAISSFSSSPKLWKRFVDDTIVIMQTNEANRFFDHLNNVDSDLGEHRVPLFQTLAWFTFRCIVVTLKHKITNNVLINELIN